MQSNTLEFVGNNFEACLFIGFECSIRRLKLGSKLCIKLYGRGYILKIRDNIPF
jgi:hypothetical protein